MTSTSIDEGNVQEGSTRNEARRRRFADGRSAETVDHEERDRHERSVRVFDDERLDAEDNSRRPPRYSHSLNHVERETNNDFV